MRVVRRDLAFSPVDRGFTHLFHRTIRASLHSLQPPAGQNPVVSIADYWHMGFWNFLGVHHANDAHVGVRSHHRALVQLA